MLLQQKFAADVDVFKYLSPRKLQPVILIDSYLPCLNDRIIVILVMVIY